MREGLLAYCSLRVLGEDLAAAGYPTLRFDYPAAGNSLDSDLNQGGAHWTAWQKSIETAIDRLKGISGARRVLLCGVRTGGTLATLVAERRNDVAGLLLFEPVIIGRTHIRQLILEADLQRGHRVPREQGLEIHEMNFTAATVAQMAEFDLRNAALPCRAACGHLRPSRAQADGRMRTGLGEPRRRSDQARFRRAAAASSARYPRRKSTARLYAPAGVAQGHSSGRSAAFRAHGTDQHRRRCPPAARLLRHAAEVRPRRPAVRHPVPARPRQHRGHGADPQRRARSQLRRCPAACRSGAPPRPGRHRLLPLRLRGARRQHRTTGQGARIHPCLHRPDRRHARGGRCDGAAGFQPLQHARPLPRCLSCAPRCARRAAADLADADQSAAVHGAGLRCAGPARASQAVGALLPRQAPPPERLGSLARRQVQLAGVEARGRVPPSAQHDRQVAGIGTAPWPHAIAELRPPRDGRSVAPRCTHALPVLRREEGHRGFRHRIRFRRRRPEGLSGCQDAHRTRHGPFAHNHGGTRACRKR